MQVDTPTGQPLDKRPRPRRGGARAILILFIVAVIAVGWGAFQAGQQRADKAGAAPIPTSTGTGAFAANARSVPVPTATTTAPARPRVLTLITKNLGTEENPDRVYVTPGQRGIHPRFVVRPGERIQVRLDNRDTVVHTFTFPRQRTNLDAYEESPLRPPLHAISTTKPFLAPTQPGTYRFYCRYRKPGMYGTLVVRG